MLISPRGLLMAKRFFLDIGGSEIKRLTHKYRPQIEEVNMNRAIDQKPLIFVLFLIVLISQSCSQTTPARPPAQKSAANAQESSVVLKNAQTDSQQVDFFNTNVRPILAAKCQPCHFEGGKVYAQLPFDSPKTIRKLGTRLFSRIKDENEQALIRTFLAQAPDSTTSGAGRLDR
jgi:hypothetical protein